MLKLSERHSLNAIRDALRLLRIRLRGRPESRPLVEAIEGVQRALDEAIDRCEALADERMSINAELKYLIDEFYQTIAQLAREVRAKLGGDTEQPLFFAIFPVSPSAAMREPLPARLQYGRQAALQIGENATLASLKPSAEKLLGQVVEIEALMTRRDGDHTQSERTALLKRDEAAAAARLAYNQTKPQLELLWPNRPKLVESMFYVFHRGRKAEAPDEV